MGRSTSGCSSVVQNPLSTHEILASIPAPKQKTKPRILSWSATHSYSETFVRPPSMPQLKGGLGVQFSGAPNHAVSQDEKSPNKIWISALLKGLLGVWVSGFPACGRVTAEEPAGGAADRAAPASSSSLLASRTTGPPRSFEDTRRPAPPPATP